MEKKSNRFQIIAVSLLGVLLAAGFGYYIFGLRKTVDNGVNMILSFILLGSMIVMIRKEPVTMKMNRKLEMILPFLVFFLVPLLQVRFVWSYHITMKNLFLVLQNAFLIYILQGALFVIIFRIKPVMFSSLFLNWFFFLADEIVLVLRKTPLVPTDILSINTAMSVAGNYKFQLTSRLILATVFTMFMALVIYKLPLRKNMIAKQKLGEMVGFRVVVLALTLMLVMNVLTYEREEFQRDNFDTANMNKNVGTLLAFYLNAKEVNLKEPEGYSKDKVLEYLSQYEDDTESSQAVSSGVDEKNPNVIIIMDEAFSDLSILGDLKLNQDPLKFCHSLEKAPNVVSGKLNTSVWGGNTCNTEFEALTGNSLEMLPYGSIPYMQYVNKKTDSVCSYFHKLGYKDIAVHPYWGQCWRRDTIYDQFKFDQFIDAEKFDKNHNTRNTKSIAIHKGCDFGDLDYVREYISDKESFNQIIHQYETKEVGQKMFLFNVTMQNHGGYLYDGDNLEYTVRSSVYPNRTLSQYLSLLKKTDEALEGLISYFKKAAEPTVILFFGDHQPGLANDLYETMFGRSYEDFTIADYQKRYTVPYYIWANYPLKNVSYKQISANYLTMVLKDAAGMPMDSWDKFRKDVYQKYPVLTARMIQDANGIRHTRSTVDDELLRKYEMIQYDRLMK